MGIFKKVPRGRTRTIAEDGTEHKSFVVEPVKYVEEPVPMRLKKKQKVKDLDDLIVEHNGILYDAHESSINKMNAVVSLANFKAMNSMYLLSKDMILTQKVVEGDVMYDYCTMVVLQYEAIYKRQIKWRGATNETHSPQIESICEALEVSMGHVSNIIGVKQ